MAHILSDLSKKNEVIDQSRSYFGLAQLLNDYIDLWVGFCCELRNRSINENKKERFLITTNDITKI